MMGDNMRDGGRGGGNMQRMEEKDRILRQGLCFRCKEKGHRANECPSFSNEPPRSNQQVDLRARIDNRGG